MSKLVVFTFEDQNKATQARETVRELERHGSLALDDALVLTRDAEGKVHRHRDPSSAVIIGAVLGGLLGFLLIFMFPVVSVVFGAAAGALLGRLIIDRRVDDESVVETEAELKPGTSALLLLIRAGDLKQLGAALRGQPLHLYHTTLAHDADLLLRHSLE